MPLIKDYHGLDIATVRRDYTAGLTWKEMQRKYQVSYHTLRMFMKANEIELVRNKHRRTPEQTRLLDDAISRYMTTDMRLSELVREYPFGYQTLLNYGEEKYGSDWKSQRSSKLQIPKGPRQKTLRLVQAAIEQGALTVAEVHEETGVTKTTIRKYIAQGHIIPLLNKLCLVCQQPMASTGLYCSDECSRVSDRARTYGITPQEVLELPEDCEICGRPAEVVDHDHVSGDVRGSLCGHCNKGLGFFKDSDELLYAAIRYLG